jgi:hypothetical protein
MKSNVVPFEQSEDKRRQEKDHDAFNAVWACYLRTRADLALGRSDQALDRALDAQCDAMWG